MNLKGLKRSGVHFFVTSTWRGLIEPSAEHCYEHIFNRNTLVPAGEIRYNRGKRKRWVGKEYA